MSESAKWTGTLTGTCHGYEMHLSHDRIVGVARAGNGSGYAFWFVSGGVETKLGLSNEAVAAMLRALELISTSPPAPSDATEWVLVDGEWREGHA